MAGVAAEEPEPHRGSPGAPPRTRAAPHRVPQPEAEHLGVEGERGVARPGTRQKPTWPRPITPGHDCSRRLTAGRCSSAAPANTSIGLPAVVESAAAPPPAGGELVRGACLDRDAPRRGRARWTLASAVASAASSRDASSRSRSPGTITQPSREVVHPQVEGAVLGSPPSVRPRIGCRTRARAAMSAGFDAQVAGATGSPVPPFKEADREPG